MISKKIYKVFHRIATICAVFCTIILFLVGYFSASLPMKFYVTKGQEFSLKNVPFLSESKVITYNKTNLADRSIGATETVNLNLFSVIPIKSAYVSVIDEQEVTPGGTAFGIKLFTKGVMVIGVNDVKTESGAVSPCKLSGISKGDIILSINGQSVANNENLSAIISASGGLAVCVSYTHEGELKSTFLTPARSAEDGVYRGGLWVRDSSAGIGTMTYYNPATGVFAGLGHGICDSDTGEIMPLESGEVCDVNLVGLIKGEVGTPGELKGSFASPFSHGRLLLNNECGIFGILNEAPNNFDSIPIKLKQDVHTGPAMILCSLSNNEIKSFSINIDKIDLNPKTLTKNMTLTVTDPELLNKTGGIIQGMSGSPILQDNHLVGAVTHVFVNNPKRGYGIFVENMLSFSSTLANANK